MYVYFCIFICNINIYMYISTRLIGVSRCLTGVMTGGSVPGMVYVARCTSAEKRTQVGEYSQYPCVSTCCTPVWVFTVLRVRTHGTPM